MMVQGLLLLAVKDDEYILIHDDDGGVSTHDDAHPKQRGRETS